MSKNFALIGAAGYIAPRHMRAIKDTNNNLVAALDPSDSVGILDSYSHEISFFKEFERFDRHAEKLRRQGGDKRLHYVSICSPNYLHDSHIRFALRMGADAICEKPLVLNPWNVEALAQVEQESKQRIFNVLQLRVHPSLVALKEKVARQPKKNYNIDLTYITSRGYWYFVSWKGDLQKSGGVTTNVGIHFFDMLQWIFGPLKGQEVYYNEPRKACGYIELENANVRWFLSVDRNDLAHVPAEGKSTFRSITVEGEEIEFSGGFTDLHTEVYRDILAGGGFGLDDARPSIETAYKIRNAKCVKPGQDTAHPLLAKTQKYFGDNPLLAARES